MMCSNPYMGRQGVFGCGQCMPCRVNTRRTWLHRIILEASLYKDNAFVTLTYSDYHLPRSYEKAYETHELSPAYASLDPSHLRNWLKRFRKALAPLPLRFFAIGEYGDQTHRPHYHAMLFNYPPCSRVEGTRYKGDEITCCENCARIHHTWGLGRIFVGSCSMESAGYIAGYVTKKMTAKDDPRLIGRYPEFSRMSTRPGLGADVMDEVASTLLTLDLDKSQGDVPSSLRHGKRELPLGRYLKSRLRQRLGRDPGAPQSVFDEVAAELLPLRQAAFDSSSSLKEEIIKAGQGKRASMEARQRIYKKRGSL